MLTTLARPARQAWTAAEWRAFTKRCQIARNDLEVVVTRAVRVQGTNARLVDAGLKVMRQLRSAMTGLESLIISHDPGLAADVMKIVHGKPGKPIKHDEMDRPFTRAEWVEIGNALKELRVRISQLGQDLQSAKGASKSLVRQFHRAADLGTLRSRLDEFARRQHPAWDQVSRLFYGALVSMSEDAES